MDRRSTTDELEARITAIDARFKSPDERAEEIWTLLRTTNPSLTDWDILCFSSGAIALLSQAYPWLEKDAKKLSNLVYHAHYLLSEEHDRSTGLTADGKHTNRESAHRSDRQQEDNIRTPETSEQPNDSNRNFTSSVHIRTPKS